MWRKIKHKKLPASQLAQVLDAAREYVPAEHEIHVTAPTSEYFPLTQVSVAAVRPRLAQYEPAKHEIQEAEPELG